MSKFDDFDLDLQNIKVSNNISPNKTGYTILSCPTVPVLECTKEITKVTKETVTYTEQVSCNNTMCTCPSGNCPGSVDHCQQNI